MKIPQGMTESEVVYIIDKVANRLAKRFKFGYHDLDDMRQQARLYALEIIEKEKYDGVRPLENFLWTHVRNRLFNFKRDKYQRPDQPCIGCPNFDEKCVLYECIDDCGTHHSWTIRNSAKKNIMQPIDINNVSDEREQNMRVMNLVSGTADYDEIIDILDREVPLQFRNLYLKLLIGAKLTKQQKVKIQLIIREILEKYGYNNPPQEGEIIIS